MLRGLGSGRPCGPGALLADPQSQELPAAPSPPETGRLGWPRGQGCHRGGGGPHSPEGRRLALRGRASGRRRERRGTPEQQTAPLPPRREQRSRGQPTPPPKAPSCSPEGPGRLSRPVVLTSRSCQHLASSGRRGATRGAWPRPAPGHPSAAQAPRPLSSPAGPSRLLPSFLAGAAVSSPLHKAVSCSPARGSISPLPVPAPTTETQGPPAPPRPLLQHPEDKGFCRRRGCGSFQAPQEVGTPGPAGRLPAPPSLRREARPASPGHTGGWC